MNVRVISAILAICTFVSQSAPVFAETVLTSEPNRALSNGIPLSQVQASSNAAQQNVNQMNFLQTLSGPVQTSPSASASVPTVPNLAVADPDNNFSVIVAGNALTATFPSDQPFRNLRYLVNLDDLSSFTVETRSLIISALNTQTRVDAASDSAQWRASLTRLSDNLKSVLAGQTNPQTVQSLQTLMDHVDSAQSSAPTTFLALAADPSSPADELQSAVQSDATVRDAFTTLFAYRILQIGEASAIVEVASEPGFDLQSFLTVVVKARQLQSAMFQNLQHNDFAFVFDRALPMTDHLPAATTQQLFDVAGDPAFNQEAFLTVLNKAASLYAALQQDSAARTAMNQRFGTQFQEFGSLTHAPSRTTLFNLTGDPDFDQTAFIAELKGQSAPGASLFVKLQASSGAIVAFDALYGTNLASGTASQPDLDILNNVATSYCYPNDCGLDYKAYLPVLLKTYAFYTGLATSGLGDDFNRMQNHQRGSYDPYGAPTFMDGNKPSGLTLKNMFNLAGNPSFDIAAYLTVLPKAASLVRALGVDQAALAAFNQRFGTSLQEVFFYKGYWPSIYAPEDGKTLGTLFDITGDSNFDEAGFISWVKNGAAPPGSTGQALLQALKGVSGAEQAFDTIFFPDIFVKGRGVALNDVASQPGFDTPVFIAVLLKANTFYSAIALNGGLANDFAVLFNLSIPSAVSNQTRMGLNGEAIRVVFGLVGDPSFNLTTFTDGLIKAGSLIRALQADGSLRTAFNERYGTQVPAAGAIQDGGPTRTALFDLVEDPAYQETAFLNSLKAAPPVVTPTNPPTDWLKANQQASPYGLLESYPDDPSIAHQGFTYDEAVTGMLLLKQGDLGGARRILNFFKSQWDGLGFRTVYNTQDPTGSVIENDRILGPTAWVGLFALQDFKTTRDASSLELADKIARWALTLPRTDDGVAMGALGTFWADKYSVENNLDAYALFKGLSVQSSSDSARTLFAAEASKVKAWLLAEGYNAQTGLFRRGGYLGGNVNALDVNSWAILALGPETLKNDFGIDPDALLTRTENMLAVQADGSFGGDVLTAKGFDFSGAENAAETGRLGINWVEGTNHMILAYKIMATYHIERADLAKADYYSTRANYFSLVNFRCLAQTQQGEGYSYTDTAGAQVYSDNPYWHAGSGPSTAATAWVYFTRTDFNPFSN